MFYLLSNAFYIAIILLILIFTMRREYIQETGPALILPWLFTLYPIFAHSLFEASERHRYGTLSFMALFAAMAICRPVSAGRVSDVIPARLDTPGDESSHGVARGTRT